MQSWEWAGYFTIEVPDSWTIEVVDGGLLQIEPPTRASACHVSTARRNRPVLPTGIETEQVARRFPPLLRTPDARVLVASFPGYFTASASFIEDIDGKRSWWEVRIVLTQYHGIVWSWNHQGDGAAERADALSIWASLKPDVSPATTEA
jgi:hypothetical protein